jgi:fatty acyl-ACP thioesterase B
MLEKLNGFCRGGVMEVDIWVGASGKNGIRRDWLIRSDATGEVLARATRYFSEHPHPFFHGSLGSSNKVLQMLSRTWAMMNQQTRRLSKMPEAIRAEISPGFIE